MENNIVEPSPEPRRTSARFGLATLLVAVTAIAVAIFLRLDAAQSDATAYLLVSRSAVDDGWPASLQIQETNEDYDRFRRTQAELMKSKPMLTRAFRDPSLTGVGAFRDKKDAVRWLEENLKVDFPNDAEVMRVRLRSRDGNEAVRVVNAVVQAYMKEVVEQQMRDRMRVEVRMKELLQQKTDALVRDKRDILSLRKSLGDSGTDSPELQSKENRIRVQQETVDELTRQIERLSITKQFPARVQKLDDANL